MITIQDNFPEFASKLIHRSRLIGRSVADEFVANARLIDAELIQRTPPFSGKSIVRSISSRGATLRDLEVESLTAQAVGKRRVEKDIRKVIYGLTGATFSARHYRVSKGANPNAMDWGTLQRCEGKQAVRVFATKTGEVYGADISDFRPDVSISELRNHHQAQRTNSGRVTMAGQKTRNVGRWRWLNVVVTKEASLRAYLKQAWRGVGQGKGGWAEGLIQLGGRLSRTGWIGRHAKAGSCRKDIQPYRVNIEIENNSRWASGGDREGIIQATLSGREKAVESDIQRRIEEAWKQ